MISVTYLHAMLVHLHTVFVDKHRVRMGLVLTHKSVSLSLPASFLPASVRYGSRSKLQQRWFTFSLSSCFVQFLPSFLFRLCSLSIPPSLALPFRIADKLSYCILGNVTSSSSEMLFVDTRLHTHIRVPAVLRHPFPLFLCLFPRSAFNADCVFLLFDIDVFWWRGLGRVQCVCVCVRVRVRPCASVFSCIAACNPHSFILFCVF